VGGGSGAGVETVVSDAGAEIRGLTNPSVGRVGAMVKSLPARDGAGDVAMISVEAGAGVGEGAGGGVGEGEGTGVGEGAIGAMASEVIGRGLLFLKFFPFVLSIGLEELLIT
jgi:hypothetical protein